MLSRAVNFDRRYRSKKGDRSFDQEKSARRDLDGPCRGGDVNPREADGPRDGEREPEQACDDSVCDTLRPAGPDRDSGETGARPADEDRLAVAGALQEG